MGGAHLSDAKVCEYESDRKRHFYAGFEQGAGRPYRDGPWRNFENLDKNVMLQVCETDVCVLSSEFPCHLRQAGPVSGHSPFKPTQIHQLIFDIITSKSCSTDAIGLARVYAGAMSCIAAVGTIFGGFWRSRPCPLGDLLVSDGRSGLVGGIMHPLLRSG